MSCPTFRLAKTSKSVLAWMHLVPERVCEQLPYSGYVRDIVHSLCTEHKNATFVFIAGGQLLKRR
eukprot:762669-Hanusia_phi.AAC.2